MKVCDYMKSTKICKLCGEPFHPNSTRQQCCNKPIVRYCEICGSPISGICSTSFQKVTCSSKCSAKLIKRNREKSASNLVKTCKWCGKEFHPKSVRDEYCYDIHFQTCEICGQKFIIDVRRDKTVKTCSPECKKALQLKNRDFQLEHIHQKETLMKRYGVENSALIPGSAEKAKETSRKRYGTDYYTQTEEYKERVKQTSKEKYGVDHFLQNPEVIEKRKQTCKSLYGVDNVSKTVDVQSKIKKVFNEKYGVDNISQLHIDNLNDWNEFLKDSEKYILDHFDGQVTIKQLCKHFGVCASSVYNNLSPDSMHLIKRSISYMEEEVIEYLTSIYPEIQIETHNRAIIRPYELDIYLPEFNLAIECNPTVTHNSSQSYVEKYGIIPKGYHKLKTDLCIESGIFLFHIFGYEWTWKQDQLKSMLRNLLSLNTSKIYARNCEVRQIDFDTAKNFLVQYHRQGFTVSKINLGMYYNDELVSVMTFGKIRGTIGSKSNSTNHWELLRFCSKFNYTVIGGASKIFKYFIKNYNPSKIRSFSDRAHTKGNIYKILAFTPVSVSDANYIWVNFKTDQAFHRINAQKRNLKKFLQDDSIDLKKTEKQIMEEHGYVQVFDSGTITWEWVNSTI